jgi:hypothetical protein
VTWARIIAFLMQSTVRFEAFARSKFAVISLKPNGKPTFVRPEFMSTLPYNLNLSFSKSKEQNYPSEIEEGLLSMNFFVQ